MTTSAHEYAKQHHTRFKDRFIELLKHKSISTDLAFKQNVLDAANWIADRMTAIGLSSELIHMDAGQHPVVMGTWNGAGDQAKTVLIYCHYDVQPAVVADGWDSDPFNPVIRDGKIVARGATDSKVHVMAWLSAVEALLATTGSDVNLKLLFEGEEEALGITINTLVQQHPDKVAADLVVISDGIIRHPEQPSLIYGLRGIVTFELHIYGPQHDLHSGHWGGTVHNPAQVITEIISQLHDENGMVTVDGFYDDVATLSAEERAFLAESDESIAEEWQTVAGAPKQWGEPDFTLHERLGARPTLEINGIHSGYTGEGFKTVLPAHAMAKISCRLVPDQDPAKVLEQVQSYVRKIAPETVRVECTHSEFGAPAILIDYKSNAMQAAFRAYEKGWGVKPVFERAGGSVPITHDLMRVTDNIAIMGFSYKGGQAHGPNENIPLQMFYNGIDTAIYFLQDISSD